MANDALDRWITGNYGEDGVQPDDEPENETPEDDPVCVCGVSRSEHALCGCPEGFQTPAAWEHEKEFIESLDEWEFERIYGEG